MSDLNGDGKADLLVGNSGATNKIYLNPGSGDFSSVIPLAIGVDVDDTRALLIVEAGAIADSRMVVVGNAGQTNKLYVVPPVATNFPNAVGIDIGSEADDTRSIVVAHVFTDVESESQVKADIVVANFGLPVKTYLNPGTATSTIGPVVWGTVVPLTADGSGGTGDVVAADAAFSLGLGDIDSNGFLDVVAGNLMYLNPGGASAGNFINVEPYPFALLREDVQSVAMADLDADGDLVRAYLHPTSQPVVTRALLVLSSHDRLIMIDPIPSHQPRCWSALMVHCSYLTLP